MAKYKLIDIASVIRSKNSGPYELTFDVIFKDFDIYGKVKAVRTRDLMSSRSMSSLRISTPISR